jgi:hypothetical protein
MQRTLKFDTEVLIGQRETVVEIRQDRIEAWALEVSLLLSGLNDTLVVRSTTKPTIMLSVLPEERKRKAARTTAPSTVVTRSKPDKLTFQLSRTEAEAIQATLLRAYRDEMAEVNHIHIGGLFEGVTYDLTLFFDVSRERLSARTQ